MPFVSRIVDEGAVNLACRGLVLYLGKIPLCQWVRPRTGCAQSLPPIPAFFPTANSSPCKVCTGLSVKTGIKAPALRTWNLSLPFTTWSVPAMVFLPPSGCVGFVDAWHEKGSAGDTSFLCPLGCRRDTLLSAVRSRKRHRRSQLLSHFILEHPSMFVGKWGD